MLVSGTLALSTATADAYKALHNKLSYMVRTKPAGDAKRIDAETGLALLRSNRDDMLENFMRDQSLTWISQLKKEKMTESVQGKASTAEWYNQYQMIDLLKIGHLDESMKQSELNRYVSRDHPNKEWAAKGEKEYQHVRIQDVNNEMDRDTLREESEAAEQRGKRAGTKRTRTPLEVNFETACRKSSWDA